MRYFIVAFTLLLFTFSGNAQSEESLIQQALLNYIQGTSYNEPDRIEEAFYPEANLFLDHPEKELYIVEAKEYISWYDNKEHGAFNGRIGNVLSIDRINKIASAKAEIIIPSKHLRYVDLFLLKKIDDQWKIISKTASIDDNPIHSKIHGDKILFILSNAAYYGDSDIRTGNSYYEIVNAYDTFKKAGYTVEFVSPEGGSVPLAYINTSDSLYRQYIYDQDLMYALENTRKPSDITPKDYKAVHYVGGGAAMFGVPENQAIQNISMAIYEDYNGIISSVCHGTAGIVHLKTRDGKYLYENKTVNGYPDSYENTERDYFQHFPFLIQQTIEQRGGLFKFGPRNNAHVETDGRVITGQNYLSSAPVALKIIEQLQTMK